MFLTEKELKDKFWKNYNYSQRAVRYQFECPIREGGADLVTVELYQNNVQFNAFEFKLNDIKKVILQAKANAAFVHKSWIVIPSEKSGVILDRYKSYLDEIEVVGVICVEEGGKWEMVYKPKFQKNIVLHQSILKLMLTEMN